MVLHHEFLYKIFSFWADGGPDLSAEFPDAPFHFLDDLLVTAIEGWWSTKHDVEHDTDAPQVALLRVVAGKHFWSNVVRSAVHLVHLSLFFTIMVRCAKVNDFDGTLLVDVNENVLGLQVSVSNIPAVAVSDCLQDLFDDVSSLLFSELFAGWDFFEEFTALTKLSDEEKVCLALVHFVEADDIRMIQVL